MLSAEREMKTELEVDIYCNGVAELNVIEYIILRIDYRSDQQNENREMSKL